MKSHGQPPLIRLRPTLRKVAIVRALHIGDLLMAVPAWRALRHVLPHAEITLIGLPWAREFVQRFSKYIDRWVEFPGYPGMLEVDVDPARTEAFLLDAQRYGYDLAIQMHGDGSTSNYFTAQLGAKHTAGYHREGRPGPELSFSLPYPDGVREVLKHLQLMEFLGAEPQGTHLEFPLSDMDYAEVARIPELKGVLDSARQDALIGIHPGARPPARRWPPERFAAVADELARCFGARIVVMAGPGEESLADEVRQRMGARAIDVAGRLSIGGLAALLSKLDLVIANDSGPAHLAEAVGTKSITIFGPADPNRWAPLEQTVNRVIYKKVACSPCPHWECPTDHRCMRRIRVSDVLSVAEALLSWKGNARQALIEFQGAYEQKTIEDSDLAHSRHIS